MPLDPRAIITNGENAKTEFKRDDRNLRPEHLARAIVAFANMNGGMLVLGVDDDGTVSGVSRTNLQAWLMDTVIGRYVDPQLIPDYEEFVLDGKPIAVVTVSAGAAKPYGVRQQDRIDYYLRLGDTVQRAGREQMARLFQSGGLVSVEKMPVHGSSLADLDMRRLEDYFLNILGEDAVDDWPRTLLNRDLLIADEWRPEVSCCSFAACVLFGREPRRRMPQAGIRLLVFPGTDLDYDASLDEVLDLPFVGLKERREREFIEQSLPSRVLSYLQPHVSRERLDGMQRRRHWDYPKEVIRELLVNAFAHRDWTRPTDVQLTVFADRLEVHSPGALPNGVTVEKATEGLRVPRNPNIVNILRDYEFMEHRGMGIRRTVIPLTRAHNGTTPDFEATEDYFKVTLRKGARPEGAGSGVRAGYGTLP